jgi:transcriptional regulator with XRE-family HTH domain
MAAGDKVKFGKAVRELRLARRWTQEELADRARLHSTYIGGIERGERNVSLENIIRIARALGEHPSVLFKTVRR